MVKESNKPKILIFVSHYLPGYKSGGPLRTIVNMVDHLSDDLDMLIVTKDRDLGETESYQGVEPNQWQQVGRAKVYYVSPERCTVKNIAAIIKSTPHDVLYLNSFFDFAFSIKPLIARKLGWVSDKPIVLAPRGEFSKGAINLKAYKKSFFIRLVKILGLYNNLTWQASSEHEVQDICRVMGDFTKSIHVAIDLPSKIDLHAEKPSTSQTEFNEILRVVFLSRISPKKNLDYALTVLTQVNTPLVFDIYGPAEDEKYWNECEKLIENLPENIRVNYRGSIHPEQVSSTFSNYDLFFLPTRGENYGHVIAESISVGTPVLISDQTPWRDLAADKLGWDLPLNDLKIFAEKIESVADMESSSLSKWREEVRAKAIERLSAPRIVQDNKDLFLRAIREHSKKESR
jgi:glycosyltransferase involved in cell wall biosynthesis